MKPRIDGTTFGSITVAGKVFEHDVVIRPDGQVKKRKKKLSRAVYGTSHKISLREAKYVCERAPGVDHVIIGSGQYGNVELSPAAAAYLKRRRCRVDVRPTPKVIAVWNRAKGGVVGLFHVTC